MTAIMIRKNNVVTNEARIAVKSICEWIKEQFKASGCVFIANLIKNQLKMN
jgi:hypothetical protein